MTITVEDAMLEVYVKPPIVEAVLDFGLPPFENIIAFGEALGQELRSNYPRFQELTSQRITVSTEDSEPSYSVSKDGFLLASADKLRAVVGNANGLLSVHVGTPYPGWRNFVEQVSDVVATIPIEAKSKDLSHIGLRYIDRIHIPFGALMTDYLTLLPTRSRFQPAGLEAFQMMTRSSDDERGISVELLMLSEPEQSQGGDSIIRYELYVRQNKLASQTMLMDDFQNFTELLHSLQRRIFEDSITEKLRETFR